MADYKGLTIQSSNLADFMGLLTRKGISDNQLHTAATIRAVVMWS